MCADFGQHVVGIGQIRNIWVSGTCASVLLYVGGLKFVFDCLSLRFKFPGLIFFFLPLFDIQYF